MAVRVRGFLVAVSFLLVAVSAGDAIAARRFALLVGVGTYEDARIPSLAAPRNDVILLGATLVGRLGFAPERVVPLIDAEATKRQIELQLSRLAEYAEPDDMVVVYFSGHGSYDDDLDGDEEDGTDEFLLPFDTNLDALTASAISDDLLGYWMQRCRSKNVLLFFDSCHSGGAARGTRGFAGPRTAKSRAISRDSVMADVSRKGIAVLTASRADELAWEDEHIGHGVFTYYLAQALAGKADADGDGRISVADIYGYLHGAVVDWCFASSRKKQSPAVADLLHKTFRLTLLPTPLAVRYAPSVGDVVVVTPERRERVLVRRAYERTVAYPGRWVMVNGYRVWDQPRTELERVPDQYEEKIIPAVTRPGDGHGRFVVE